MVLYTPLSHWVLRTAVSQSVEVNFTPKDVIENAQKLKDLFPNTLVAFLRHDLQYTKRKKGKCLNIYCKNFSWFP